MRNYILEKKNHPKFKLVTDWVKLISFTGGSQIIVQLIGLVSGILVIRLLPTSEYALYTLANTMLGTMVVLADGGIASGTIAHGGKVWQDKKKLGIVLATGMDLRRKFAVGSLIIALPFLLYLLRHHGASWLMTILILISLIPAFYTALSSTILQLAPKLNQDIGPMQRNNIISNSGRLVLTVISIFAFPWAFLAIMASGISQMWANNDLKRISAKYANLDEKPDPEIRKDILNFVKRILPGAVYYCVSGQITIWLISFFGNTTSVAQIGALGRLGMFLSVIVSVVSTLVTPRFARLPDDKKVLLKIYFQIQLGLILLGIIIVALTYMFPNQLLWIIGDDYSNLSNELILSIVGGCMGVIGGTSFALTVNRGWVVNPFLNIPIVILTIICGAILIDVSTLMGVYKLNIFIAIVEIALYYFYFIYKIKTLKTI